MSNTPTSSAQVAEGLNLEAERAAFITAYRLWSQGSYPGAHPEMVQSMAESHWGRIAGAMWLAARRTAAPVAEGVALPPLDAEGLPPLPRPDIPVGELILDPIDEPYYSKRTVEQVRNTVIAPYAERIRQLERELAEDRVVHKSVGVSAKAAETRMDASSEGGAQTIDTPEFRVLLDIYRDADGSQSKSARAALIAYIDGRTAGPAVPQWRSIETAPQDKMLLLAYEFDRPGDWRIKVGGFWDRKWNVFGATWTPTRWMPLPAAPKPQEDA